MQGIEILFGVIILIFSAIVHEVAHGYVALYLGDPTAKLAGRLTLNPLNHLDPFGSVLLPLLLAITGTPFIFGYAKPVPYNPYNLGGGKWGPALVAMAGPASNLVIAILASLAMRAGLFNGPALSVGILIVVINVVLAIFNLLPVPPLDGSKVLFALLPYTARNIEHFLVRYQLFIFLFLVIFAWQPFARVVLPFVLGLLLG
ncbi:MAG: site-2 protease family protein [bacterium]|nr:site-2 protease family protein [bacterium]